MIDKNKFQFIKNYVIQEFLQGENDLSDFDVCDEMVSRLAFGDIDNLLVNSNSNRDSLTLAHEYQNLCFYDGDFSNWLDSVEGSVKIGEQIAVYRIFQNFQFLSDLARDGGKELLESLTKLQDFDTYADSSVIECLRNTFGNDFLLKNTLLQMFSPNSIYQVFSEQQRADLLLYPEGTLYYYGQNGPTLTQPLLLAVEIHNRMNAEPMNVSSNHELEMIALELKSFFYQKSDFSDIVKDMSDNYHEFLRKISKESANDIFQLQKDINGAVPNVGWTIGNNELARMIGTPYHPVSLQGENKKK